MAEDQDRKQALERQSWDYAQIDGRDGISMVAQEGPTLRRRPSTLEHVCGDRRFRDFEAKFEQFTMNARRAPQWVVLAHLPDQLAQFAVYLGPAWPTSRFPAPIDAVPGSMPA